MATESFRKRMVAVYRERRSPTRFLSGFFLVRPGNIFDGEKVVIDIVREDEEIAAVVEVCTGPNFAAIDTFTTKEFTPPAFNEGAPFNCYDLLKRMPGTNEYDATNVSWATQLIQRILQAARSAEDKIQRTIELQASQILTLGVLTLLNKAGDTKYIIDFKMKATHLPTAGTAWNAVGATPMADLEALADVIRDDGLADSTDLIFGSDAWAAFLGNADVQVALDSRRGVLAELKPEMRGKGGKFQGTIDIGNYKFNMWTYGGRYNALVTGTKTLYVPKDKVIMLSGDSRLDQLFGGVPRAVPVDPRFAGFLPDRISVPEAVDFSLNIYTTPNGEQTILEVKSRPLLVPTAIDSFGCIATGV